MPMASVADLLAFIIFFKISAKSLKRFIEYGKRINVNIIANLVLYLECSLGYLARRLLSFFGEYDAGIVSALPLARLGYYITTLHKRPYLSGYKRAVNITFVSQLGRREALPMFQKLVQPQGVNAFNRGKRAKLMLDLADAFVHRINKYNEGFKPILFLYKR